MRIGLLTTSFPRHRHDIAGSFVLGFACALRDQGHTIEVLAPEARDGADTALEPGITTRPVPYLRPRAWQRTFYGAGVPDNLANDPLAWLGLAPFSANLLLTAARRVAHWDVLVSHWALPCALAAGAVRGNRPHIAVLHSADVHWLGRLPGRSRWAQLIVRGADALWFVSNAQRDRFLELLPNRAALPRTLVSPMGIDLPALAPLDAYARAEFRRRHQLQGFCVLVLGRLVAIKGVDVAVRAAAMGGMTLLVAGDGPARAELVQLARELSVPVRWLGVVVGEDKQRWFEAVDAFVLPSRRLPDGRSEGLPCALLEALAHGLPVVASRLDGITELFEDDGYAHALVPPDDPAALHAALLALGERHAHDNRDDRDNNRDNLTRQQYGRDGRDGSRDVGRFGWSQVGARIAELLEHAETARRTDTAQGIGRSLR